MAPEKEGARVAIEGIGHDDDDDVTPAQHYKTNEKKVRRVRERAEKNKLTLSLNHN